MSWTLVQQNLVSGSGTPASPITCAFTSAQGAGNLVVVKIRLFSTTNNTGAPAITGVTDTKGNGPSGSYKKPIGADVLFFSYPLTMTTLYAWNIASAAANANTVSVAWTNGTGAGVNAWWVSIEEWSNSGGAVSVDPFDDINANVQSNNTATPSVLVNSSKVGNLITAHAHGNGGQSTAGTVGGNAATLINQASGSASEYGISTATGLLSAVSGSSDQYWDMQAISFCFGGSSAIPLPRCVQFMSDHISSGTSSSVTFLAGNTAGNLIVLVINQQSALASVNPIVDTAGNTYYPAGNMFSTPLSLPTNAIYYAYNCKPGANTVTVTWVGSATDYFGAFEFSGIVSASNPLIGFNYGYSLAGSTRATTNAIYVNQSLAMAVSFFNPGGSAQVDSVHWSGLDVPDNNLEVVQFMVVPSPTSLTATCTFPGAASEFWDTNIAGFLSLAGTLGPTVRCGTYGKDMVGAAWYDSSMASAGSGWFSPDAMVPPQVSGSIRLFPISAFPSLNSTVLLPPSQSILAGAGTSLFLAGGQNRQGAHGTLRGPPFMANQVFSVNHDFNAMGAAYCPAPDPSPNVVLPGANQIAAAAAVQISSGPFPVPLALPPAEIVASGAGVAPQVWDVVTPTLLPPSATLPPQDLTLIGFGVPSQVGVQTVLSPNPSSAVLPPQDSSAQGFGQPSQVAIQLVGQPPPPLESVPLQDQLFAGSGAPPQVPQQFVGQPLFTVALLPPQDSIFGGQGQPSQAAVQLVGQPPPVLALLPPQEQVFAGAGSPSQTSFQFAVSIPPFTVLPPSEVILSGVLPIVVAGGVLYGIPAGAAVLPPQDSTTQGSGQVSQVAQQFIGVPPFAVPLLPPQLYVIPGANPPVVLTSGSIAQARVVDYVGLPASSDAIAPGFGIPSQVAQQFTGQPPFVSALFPPQDSIYVGANAPLSGVAYIVFGRTSVDPVNSPPRDSVLTGFGQSPSVAVQLSASPIVNPVLLPPQDSSVRGFGLPSQVAYQAFATPLFTPYALPPQDSITLGFGQPSQVPVVFVGQPPPITAALPPLDSVLQGSGQPSQVAVQNVGVPPLPTILPPQDSIYVGAGASQSPQQFTGFPAPFITLPPQLYVIPGANPPVPPTSGPTIRARVVDYALLPASPDVLVRGSGAPSQVAQQAVGQPAPASLLPPQDSTTQGSGQAPTVAIHLVGQPPITSVPFSPQDEVLAGAGVPAANAFQVYGVPPQPEVLPPQDSIAKGAGIPSAVAVHLVGQPPPVLALLPPLDSVLGGGGQAPQPPVQIVSVVPVLASLPPQSVIGTGGLKSVAGYVVVVKPPPETFLPTKPVVQRGAGIPSAVAVHIQAVPPFYVALPALPDSLFAGFGSPPPVSVPLLYLRKLDYSAGTFVERFKRDWPIDFNRGKC